MKTLSLRHCELLGFDETEVSQHTVSVALQLRSTSGEEVQLLMTQMQKRCRTCSSRIQSVPCSEIGASSPPSHLLPFTSSSHIHPPPHPLLPSSVHPPFRDDYRSDDSRCESQRYLKISAHISPSLSSFFPCVCCSFYHFSFFFLKL